MESKIGVPVFVMVLTVALIFSFLVAIDNVRAENEIEKIKIVPDNELIGNGLFRSVEINNDIVEASIKYSACNKHDFDLVWDGTFQSENSEKIISAYLKDVTGRDKPYDCHIILDDTVIFDLTPLKKK